MQSWEAGGFLLRGNGGSLVRRRKVSQVPVLDLIEEPSGAGKGSGAGMGAMSRRRTEN